MTSTPPTIDASRPRPAIVVTGDVVVDHHLYEGDRQAPMDDHKRGVRHVSEWGGAVLLRRTLAKLVEQGGEPWDVLLGLDMPLLDGAANGHHAYAIWKPMRGTRADTKAEVWRLAHAMGYAAAPPSVMRPRRAERVPAILVFDDAGAEFRRRSCEDLWLLPKEDEKERPWIVLKMSRPVARGDLWHRLADRFAGRLVCVVSADELRHECVGIGRGLSWERTVEELRDALQSNSTLKHLRGCRHLIVTFAADGALWLENPGADAPAATLVFDPQGSEGEWSNSAMVGTSAPFIAAVCLALMRHLVPKGAAAAANPIDARDGRGSTAAPLDLAPAIETGLAAMRDLLDLGHGEAARDDEPAGYPAARLAEAILTPTDMFARAAVPWSRKSGAWTIIEESQRALGSNAGPSLAGLARQVVLQGKPALKRLPHAVFGKLTTADRSEIEALRNVKRLMLGYRAEAKADKPLSIGVFGPPGAGKSFGVKQIAADLFGEKAWLEFNLSQFNGAADLVGAFHQVRDRVLGGETPVVFWDEFDSREYDWLQYLLAPMQDGRFQAGQLTHAIGKCVFVFAGGTSPTFGDFGPFAADPSAATGGHPLTNEEKEAVQRFKLRKGPDFKSRLDAYLDVIGPNQRTLPRTAETRNDPPRADATDVCPPLRRALFIRSKLESSVADRLDFDSDLLDALLQVPAYRNGARSLEKLVLALKPAPGAPIRRSSLPAAPQLAMHVDPVQFKAILDRNEGFKTSERIESLAAGIHAAWRGLAGAKQPDFAKDYEALSESAKEDNRAAARRIPEILALAGMGIADADEVAPADVLSDETIRAHLEHHLERLAEAEHDGWVDQRRKNGWRRGDRNDDERLHPSLMPYGELPKSEKGKDRNSILKIPDMVANGGYRIVWLKDRPASNSSL